MRFCGHCGASLAIPGKTFDISKTQTLAFSPGVLSDGTMFASRYLVIDDLGKGGMGHVYRVLDTKIDEEVALKFINAEIAADVKIIERFRNELKITRKITHRHVCRMYDLSEDNKSLFITMEYIPGEDLGNMIRRLGQLPLEKAFPIAQQVCEGLAEVHRLGVVHRDLKPKNIMIDREGNAKIMDFGLARTPHGIKLTEVGHVVGTPAFMSPEQVNGENVDQRSDIFTLGIIMFTMLTGKLPFEADTALTLALLHKTHRPPNPNTLNPRVSREFGQIILKCLEVEREKRYQTAQELLADLKKVGERFDTYAIQVPDRAKGTRARPFSRLPWSKVITVTSLMLALAASGLAVKTLIKKSRLNAGRKQAIQEIDRLIMANDLSSAFQLARQVEKEAPADRRLAALWPRMSSTLSVRTAPPGAAVSLKDDRLSGMDMQVVGQTPLDNVRVPLSQISIRIEKEGYVTLEDTTSDVGGSIHCLLVEKSARLTDSKRASVDEIIQNGNRISYKINAGLDHGIMAGDKGAIYDQKGGGPGEGTQVVALFLVKELLRDRSLIETRDQKGDIRLGHLVKFDERMTAVTVTIKTVPDRASLFIDGVQMGLSGNPVNLSPGKHLLRLIKPGYQVYQTTIEVGSDSQVQLIKEFRLTPQSPTQGTLSITSEPYEAEVYLAGSPTPAGTTPFIKDVVPGKVRVRVSKADYQDQEEEIEVSPGEQSSKHFTLPPLYGYIEITSVPAGADVFIDLESAGKTPLTKALKPGTYELKVVMKGMRAQPETITIYPGETRTVEYTSSASKSTPTRYLLKVSSDPPGATVTVNGVLQKDKTPLLVTDCDTPDVHLAIEKEGFGRQEKDLKLRPAPYLNEWPPFNLEKLSKAQLTISSSDPAQVFLDGNLLGTSPPQIPASTYEGQHTVKWVLEGMIPFEKEISLRPNETQSVHFNKDDHRDLLIAGQYEFSANPRAELEIDGKSQGTAPPNKMLRGQEGPHNVKYTFQDTLGKTLVVVEINDILENRAAKKIHVATEVTDLKSVKDPDFSPERLDPSKEDWLIIRAHPPGSSLDNLAFYLDGRGLDIASSGDPLMLRVPSRNPHTLKLDIRKAGKGRNLEIKLCCPDIDKRLIISINMTVF